MFRPPTYLIGTETNIQMNIGFDFLLWLKRTHFPNIVRKKKNQLVSCLFSRISIWWCVKRSSVSNLSQEPILSSRPKSDDSESHLCSSPENYGQRWYVSGAWSFLHGSPQHPSSDQGCGRTRALHSTDSYTAASLQGTPPVWSRCSSTTAHVDSTRETAFIRVFKWCVLPY